jgi:hypothetical protein
MKPPLRAGLDPLIRLGLIEEPLSFETDEFLKFLVCCEMTYRENVALKQKLKKCKVDPVKFLESQEFPVGSRGPHRLVFDGWYIQIAKDLRVRLSKQTSKKSV